METFANNLHIHRVNEIQTVVDEEWYLDRFTSIVEDHTISWCVEDASPKLKKKKKKRKKISSIFIHRGSCCWICSKERKVSLENRMEWVGLRGKGSFLIYSRYEKAFAFYIYIIRSSYSQVFLSPSICQHVRRYDMPWRQIWPRFHVWRTCKIATISPTVNRLSQWRQFS